MADTSSVGSWKVYPENINYVANSSTAEVCNCIRNSTIKPHYKNKGSPYVNIGFPVKKVKLKIVIWSTFMGSLPEGYKIYYKDGDKRNNSLANLECCTPEEHKRTLAISLQKQGWFAHPKYKNYLANIEGFVYSLKTENVLKGHLNSSGYIEYNLVEDYFQRKVSGHVFAYECRLQDTINSKLYHVDHWNQIRDDNSMLNLSKMTHLEHSTKTRKDNPGMGAKGALQRSKPVVRHSLANELCKVYISAASAADDTPNTKSSTIRHCAIKGSKYAGYRWAYKEDDDLEGEYWATIYKHEQLKGLEVSNKGRMKTTFGIKTIGYKTGNYLSFSVRSQQFRAHYVICYAFHGAPPGIYGRGAITPDHKDRNCMNNDADNLHWATHAVQSRNKRTVKIVRAIDACTGNIIGEWSCYVDASRELSIDKSSIGRVCRGQQKTAGGMKFEVVLATIT